MHQKIRSFLFFASLYLLFSCQNGTGQNTLSLGEFKDKMEKRPEAVVLDVRSPREFQAGRVANAVNIDYDSKDFDEQISKLDTSKTYLLYCHSGGRAAHAAGKMKQAGFKNIFEMKGGYPDWEKAGYPVEK